MGEPFVMAVAALGVSLAISAIKFIDWFIHSEPKSVVRTARYVGVALAVLAVALLLILLVNQQWTAAISLAAAMILALAWYGPRLLRTPFRLLDLAPNDWGQSGMRGQDVAGDPALVARAAAVLEAYLRQQHALECRRDVQSANGGIKAGARSNGHDKARDDQDTMSEQEALDVLGLAHGAQDVEITEAHRRLVQMVHPDRGGSHYLTVKINQAKTTLLREVDRAVPARRRSTRRRAPRRDHA